MGRDVKDSAWQTQGKIEGRTPEGLQDVAGQRVAGGSFI